MILNKLMADYLREKPISRHTREEFGSDEHYAIYYLMYKIDYHRRNLRKFKKHGNTYGTSQDHNEMYHSVILQLKTQIIDMEGKLLNLFYDIGSTSSVKDLQYIYRTAIDLPDLEPAVQAMADTGIVMIDDDNIDAVWQMMQAEAEKSKKSVDR